GGLRGARVVARGRSAAHRGWTAAPTPDERTVARGRAASAVGFFGEVAGALELRAEVALVVRVRRADERQPPDDLDAVLAQRADLLRVVREQRDPLDAELLEQHGRDVVIALVGKEAEMPIRIDGVEP